MLFIGGVFIQVNPWLQRPDIITTAMQDGYLTNIHEIVNVWLRMLRSTCEQ
jgi:hypothetical protein